MKLVEIDKNMKVDNTIDKSGLKFYDIDSEPFRIYGVKRYGDKYARMPAGVAKSVSDMVFSLHSHTAGGRVRFVSNSTRVAIIARLDNLCTVAHCSVNGTNGTDIYADDKYIGTFTVPYPITTKAYESVVEVLEPGTHLFTINLPSYSGVCSLAVGLDEGATLLPAPDYKYECPVVYYGSSITQGGCASRPGRTYQSIISRRLDCNYINLGFSGSAKGEREMCEYIGGLDMSVFVCDYDHNAPTPEHLRATHEPLYRTVRASHPDIPIIFMTRPSVHKDENTLARTAVIRQTYDKALAEGDKNVYFIDVSKFFDTETNEHTVDDCHPTDLGFYFIAEGVCPILKEALEK